MSPTPDISFLPLFLGFGYNFDSLKPDGEPNELDLAMRKLLATPAEPTVLDVIQLLFPILKRILVCIEYIYLGRLLNTLPCLAR